jgi:hypothetical protein
LADEGGYETFAFKRFFALSVLEGKDKTRKIYSQFDKYGELGNSLVNECGAPYCRIKTKDVLLMTFGENMREYHEFKKIKRSSKRATAMIQLGLEDAS